MVLSALPSISALALVGVTCVYGDVELRSKIALSYLAGTGEVYRGESAPLSGASTWHSGLEGSSLGDLSGYSARDGAVEFLLQSVLQRPGEIEILAIGPLTNIATAILRDPNWAGKVKCLYVMGGDFERDFAEHNFKSDLKAAQIVFDSGIRVDVMPLNITRQVAIEIEAFDFLGESALGKEIKQWAKYKSLAFNNPHDLMALLLIFEPELFSFSDSGVVNVSSKASSSYRQDATGKARIVTGLDGDRVRQRVLEVLGSGKR